MPLEAIAPMMRRALEGQDAVGYFESWNLESLQGVIDAAEEARSPIIIGFNGDFLSRPTRVAAERIAAYEELSQWTSIHTTSRRKNWSGRILRAGWSGWGSTRPCRWM